MAIVRWKGNEKLFFPGIISESEQNEFVLSNVGIIMIYNRKVFKPIALVNFPKYFFDNILKLILTARPIKTSDVAHFELYW